jgi:hypothetical protein
MVDLVLIALSSRDLDDDVKRHGGLLTDILIARCEAILV